MDEDYYNEQFINFLDDKYLDSNSVICDFTKIQNIRKSMLKMIKLLQWVDI